MLKGFKSTIFYRYSIITWGYHRYTFPQYTLFLSAHVFFCMHVFYCQIIKLLSIALQWIIGFAMAFPFDMVLETSQSLALVTQPNRIGHMWIIIRGHSTCDKPLLDLE